MIADGTSSAFNKEMALLEGAFSEYCVLRNVVDTFMTETWGQGAWGGNLHLTTICKQRGENITDAATTLPPPADADNKPYIRHTLGTPAAGFHAHTNHISQQIIRAAACTASA